MPAKSKKQQQFMAMCEHHPEKMSGDCPPKSVAKEFAATKTKNLPDHVTKKKG